MTASKPLLTTEEILHRQKATHGRELYLQQQGLFYHAYNEAAYALQAVTGYQIRTVPYHGGYIEQLGIPATHIIPVLNAFERANPTFFVEDFGPHYRIKQIY